MESKIVSDNKSPNPDHRLWLYRPSGNIWLKTKDNLILVYKTAGSYGLDFCNSVSLESLKRDGWVPFYGTIELKE